MIMRKNLLLVSLTVVMLLTSCSKNESDALVSKVYFTNWNQCEALNTLKAYVEDVTDPKSANFILRMCARRHLTSGILCVRAFPFLPIST